LIKNGPVNEILGECSDVPDYSKGANVLDDAVEDLRTVINLVPDNYLPMVIFIDDLDRCSPNR